MQSQTEFFEISSALSAELLYQIRQRVYDQGVKLVDINTNFTTLNYDNPLFTSIIVSNDIISTQKIALDALQQQYKVRKDINYTDQPQVRGTVLVLHTNDDDKLQRLLFQNPKFIILLGYGGTIEHLNTFSSLQIISPQMYILTRKNFRHFDVVLTLREIFEYNKLDVNIQSLVFVPFSRSTWNRKSIPMILDFTRNHYTSTNELKTTLYNIFKVMNQHLLMVKGPYQSCDFVRKITPLLPQIPYVSREGAYISTLYWGQRKLLMALIEFLTKYSLLAPILVYAGAAPGNNIEFASRLFPDIEFHLYDPREFAIKPSKKIKIFTGEQGWFDDKVAESYKGKKILFFSDIRSENTEPAIIENMEQQRRWIEIMSPVISMLKFRLPFPNENIQEDEDPRLEVEYLDGDNYLQCWAPVNSTETRLVTDGKRTKTYDIRTHEQQMAYFNRNLRVCYYPHDIEADGIDHCYDCACEINILDQYFHSRGMQDNKKEIERLVEEITQFLGHGRRDLYTLVRRE